MRGSFIYLLYRLTQAAAFPFLVAYLILRGLREPRYFRNLDERFGWLPHSFHGTATGSVWLHAVSVGEVLSSVRLIERLREMYPSRRLYLSTTTLAGRALADERLTGLLDGVFYAPIDYCLAVRSVLRALRPSVVVVLETEIWPNLYREAKRYGAALIVVNGRISDPAMPRYRRLSRLFREVLAWPDRILAQNEEAAGRYRELGAPAERVETAGNLKYDFDPAKAAAPGLVRDVVTASAPEQVWIAASTMPPASDGDVDEDDAVIEAFIRLAESHPRLLLMLAPRHPTRFEAVARKLVSAGVSFLRRSELGGGEEIPLPGVLLVDSIGELSGLFRMADIVFMGGTLARRGGHNILEPALFGQPVIVGPHMENFAAIAKEFRDAGAVVEVGGLEDLAGVVGQYLVDPAGRDEIGCRARELAEAKRGATERALREIARLSDCTVAGAGQPLIARILLWPLSRLWEAGGQWKRTRALAQRRSLAVPVVSVGGISMGGSGKTPTVLHLARRLHEAGASPAILTRGYRRRYPEKSTILAAGASALTSLTGDEAQLFLGSGLAPVGIGADRYRTGSELLSRFPSDVVLLDDGFQHWRLNRDLDIVLIDALDPFPGEAVFPLGWLREPLEALAHADLFLITRADPGRPLAGIEARLRRHNPHAPVFHSRVVPLEWVDLATGEPRAPGRPAAERVAAFCGLANPASFWQTLAGLGISPNERWEFADHHHYGPRELGRISSHARAAGASVLLTTEKDFANLPPEAAEVAAPVRIEWLRIGVVIDRERELLSILEGCLRAPTCTKSEKGAEGAKGATH